MTPTQTRPSVVIPHVSQRHNLRLYSDEILNFCRTFNKELATKFETCSLKNNFC